MKIWISLVMIAVIAVNSCGRQLTLRTYDHIYLEKEEFMLERGKTLVVPTFDRWRDETYPTPNSLRGGVSEVSASTWFFSSGGTIVLCKEEGAQESGCPTHASGNSGITLDMSDIERCLLDPHCGGEPFEVVNEGGFTTFIIHDSYGKDVDSFLAISGR